MSTKISSFGETDGLKIEKFEKKYSISLPDEYKIFLLKNNGGSPEPNCFMFANRKDGSIVDDFFGLGLKEKYKDLDYNYKILKGRIPLGMLPIAGDLGGNIILIGLTGNYLGKIYFWDHEFEADEENEPNMSNVHLLASSLEDFLASLYEFEDI